MNILAKTFAVALGLALIASCGGGGNAGTPIFGSGSGASGVSGGGSSTASNLTLQLSTSSIENTGAATVTATATATTSAGQALAGIPVTFSVDNNATFTQASATTGTSGTTAAIVSIGADPSNRIITVKATSGSLTASAPFAVTGAKLTGTASPAIAAPASTGNVVNFSLVDGNGNAMAGQAISVTAGSLGTTTGTTDTNGNFAYVYTAPSAAGSLDVTATAGGTSNTQMVLIQSGTGSVPPAVGPIQSASVSANPSVVSTNTSASNNQTQIRALFVGPNNAPIQNVRVLFDLNGDINSVGGTFSTGANFVLTDANGTATTAYIPGTRSSPTDGLTIRACYSTVDFITGCPNAVTTTITVASDPLAVSIGSNAQILTGPTNLTYIRQFIVLVVDSSGRAKGDVTIVPSIDLDYYYKGQYVQPGNWIQGYIVNPNTIPVQITAAPPYRCLNEDLNRNGVLEAGEDINHSGSLEPRKSDATITILGTGQTDASGSAVVQVEYPQNVASWLHVNILVSATGVSGTEGRAVWSEVLPVPATVLQQTPSPPFVFSPYGIDITPSEIILPGDPRLSLDSTGQHTLFPDGTTPPAAALDPCHNPY
jgi:hypothetical protein